LAWPRCSAGWRGTLNSCWPRASFRGGSRADRAANSCHAARDAERYGAR
jgi:hypothetical protein